MNQPPPSTQSLMAAAQQAKTGRLPPIEEWNPPFCGDIDMRITSDGTWFYEGTPIGRPAMVRLFSTILLHQNGEFFLVTPVEKVRIQVEDAPFIAVDATETEQGLRFITNLGDEVYADTNHPVRMEGIAGDTPYIRVRGGLDAKIDRKTFYRLVEQSVTQHHEGEDWLGIRSAEIFFPLIRTSALEADT